MSKTYTYSDEDDPSIYESSGSEWDASKKPNKKRTSKRATVRKRQPLYKVDSTTSDSDADDAKPRTKNGLNKRIKLDHSTTHRNSSLKIIHSDSDFSTGSFLIAKKDVQVGDPSKPPCIWRVDGKALLQKYEPFKDDNGQIKHRTTSVYTGWSTLDRDSYAPITVTAATNQTSRHVIVYVDWDKLKLINMDSD